MACDAPIERAQGEGELEPPHEHGVDVRAGDDAELTLGGHRSGEAPIRHSYAHAALDDE